MSSLRHRADIEGLRGVAVALVLLFHFDIMPFRGGFVGVDVFFVISGYLITAITLGEFETGRFSVLPFYERRVRRIVPALLAVVLACAVACPFVFLPNDLRLVGTGLTTAVLFTSNVLFYSLANDYFAADNLDLQPMLHTWSLSVEAQFYLLYPWLLLLLRRRRWPVTWTLLVLAGLSFALSLWAVARAPSAAFYLLPSRAWELLLGGALASLPAGTMPPDRVRTPMTRAGLALIAAGSLLLTGTTPFPGAAALLPCGGAVLVIAAGSGPADPADRPGGLLTQWPLVRLGQISYSLYLWHWPLLVLAGYGRSRRLDLGTRLGLLLVAGLLATLTWRFIERPMLARRWLPGRGRLWAGAIGATLCVASLGIAIDHAGRGEIPLRLLPGAVQTLADGQFDWIGGDCAAADRPADTRLPCRFGTQAAEPSVLLWGNSFARMWSPTLDLDARARGAAGVSILRDRCLPLSGAIQGQPRDCPAFNAAALAYVESHPALRTIVLGGNWYVAGDALRGLGATVDRLDALGRRVFVLMAPPEPPYPVPRTLALAALHHQPPPGPIVEADARAAQQVSTDLIRALRQSSAFDIIDPASVLCDGIHCAVERDGFPLYYDAAHVTLHAARSAKGLFDPVFRP